LLESSSEDETSEPEEEMNDYEKLKAEMQENLMSKEEMSKFLEESAMFKGFTKTMRDKLQKSLDLETCFYGEPLVF